MCNMSIIEQATITMKQQMQLQNTKLSIPDRVEQRFNEEDEMKRKFLEENKGKGLQIDGSPSSVALCGDLGLSEGEKASMETRSPTLLRREPEMEERRGFAPMNEYPERNWGDRDQHLTRRLVLQTFDGTNADSWVLRVE